MTIEEFRNFGWKASMVVKEEGVRPLNVELVNFGNYTVGTEWMLFFAEDIIEVLNTDGTVAWRKE